MSATSVATATNRLRGAATLTWETSENIKDEAVEDAESHTEAVIDREKTQAHNIVGAAVTLGLSVIMLILMAIVAGYFVQEAPSNGAFSAAIDQVESVGGTAFILLAVALLAVPVVAIVGYFMRSGLGAFISMGGGRR
jgi:hypothetical protein